MPDGRADERDINQSALHAHSRTRGVSIFRERSYEEIPGGKFQKGRESLRGNGKAVSLLLDSQGELAIIVFKRS